MSPSPLTGTDQPDPAAYRNSTTLARRWRRFRARLRIWRARMHSHPVLYWTWCTVVGVVGGVILLAGIVMLVAPGPGWGGIVLGLAILATEFAWARKPLRAARRWLHQAKEHALEAQRRRRARKRQKQRPLD